MSALLIVGDAMRAHRSAGKRFEKSARSIYVRSIASDFLRTLLHFIENLFGCYVAGELTQLRILRRRNAHLTGNVTQQCNRAADFVLGEQAYLKVEVCALVGKCGHAVLAD